MKRTLKLMVFLFVLTFAMAQLVSGEVPATISYQGIITDINGTPLDGNYNITVNIYTTASGGTTLWGETHSGVPVVDGVFNIMLGKVAPFPSNLNFSVPYWLGISINGGAELAPRLEFASVGTALMAKTVSDGAVTNAKIAAGSITSEKIAGGQVVKSMNGLKDAVNITAGSNVSITYPGGNRIQVNAGSVGCNWSGWKKTYEGRSCSRCQASTPVLQVYCSGGVVSYMSPTTACLNCLD